MKHKIVSEGFTVALTLDLDEGKKTVSFKTVKHTIILTDILVEI